jgi:hypothetical protein
MFLHHPVHEPAVWLDRPGVLQQWQGGSDGDVPCRSFPGQQAEGLEVLFLAVKVVTGQFPLTMVDEQLSTGRGQAQFANIQFVIMCHQDVG